MRLRYVTCSVPDCLHQEVIVAENFMITLYNVFSISCFWWSTMLDVLMCILQYLLYHDQKIGDILHRLFGLGNFKNIFANDLH